jgi:hypothetical protein
MRGSGIDNEAVILWEMTQIVGSRAGKERYDEPFCPRPATKHWNRYRMTRPWLLSVLAPPALALAIALVVGRRSTAPADARVSLDVPAPVRELAEPEAMAMAATVVTTTEKLSPHPITQERRALDRQRGLFISIEGALAAGDVARARKLLREHRAAFDDAGAWLDVREGYEVIADCQEHPGPDASERGARFVAERAGSTLRRRVRKACLGPRLPSKEPP